MNGAVYVALLRQALYFRRSQGAMWVAWLVLLTLVVTPLVTFYFRHDSVRAVTLMLVLVYVMAVMVWQPLVRTMSMLNMPSHTALVPFGSRPARRLVLAASALLVMIGGLTTAIQFDCFAIGALVGGLLLAGGALMGAERFEGMVPYGAGIGAAMYLANHPAMINAPVLLWPLAVMLLASGWYATACLFPRSVERQWRLHYKSEKSAKLIAGRVDALTQQVPGPLARWYGARLQRDCAAHAQAALLFHALGPKAHWSYGLAGTLLAALLLAVGTAAVSLFATTPSSHNFGVGFLVGMHTVMQIAVVITVVQSTRTSLARTAVEQALVRLTPAMPQGQALNRTLASGLLLHASLLAGLCVLMVSGGAAFVAHDDKATANFTVMASTIFMLLPLLLRDTARMGNPMHVGALALTLLGMAFFYVSVAFMHVGQQLPLLSILPVSVLLSVAMCWWRWRALVGGPVALPAGRLA